MSLLPEIKTRLSNGLKDETQLFMVKILETHVSAEKH